MIKWIGQAIATALYKIENTTYNSLSGTESRSDPVFQMVLRVSMRCSSNADLNTVQALRLGSTIGNRIAIEGTE
jgi:hypothetical protein